jgi:hypothetical protein
MYNTLTMYAIQPVVYVRIKLLLLLQILNIGVPPNWYVTIHVIIILKMWYIFIKLRSIIKRLQTS